MFLFPSSLALGLSLFSIASIASVCLFDSRIAAAPITIIAMTNSASAMASDSQPEDPAATKSAIESAITSNNRIFWLYVFILVIGAVVTVLLFFSGNKVQEAIKADADARLKSSEVRIAALQIEVADAKRQQAEAELKLEELRKRHEPRGVNVGLIANILKTAPPAKVILLHQKGDRDSALFVLMVREALLSGGWEVLESKGVDDINERGTAQGDMMFWMRSLDNKSESIKALEKALTAAGFRLSGMRDPDLPDDTLRLKIFTKP
jgi:hypothetical protein